MQFVALLVLGAVLPIVTEGSPSWVLSPQPRPCFHSATSRKTFPTAIKLGRPLCQCSGLAMSGAEHKADNFDAFFSPTINTALGGETLNTYDETLEVDFAEPEFSLMQAQTSLVPPDPKDTGVDEKVTTLCATVSKQIYEATSKKDFDLDGGEIIIFDQHEPYQVTTPPFAVAVSGKTMILAWRGSTTIMDWVVDFAMAPITSSRWADGEIFAHGSYCSLIESDLTHHEADLIKVIQKNKITQVVFTGHSLGGGMAFCGHLAVRGQLAQSNSAWFTLRRQIQCRTVGFAAPMVIVPSKPAADQWTQLLDDVASHSCNIVYGVDLVPRLPGHKQYMLDVVKAVILPAIHEKIPLPNWVKRLRDLKKRAEDAASDLLERQSVQDLLKVCVRFCHAGKVIYYQQDANTPTIIDYQDVAGFENKDKAAAEDLKKFPVRERGQKLADAHGFFPSNLAQ